MWLRLLHRPLASLDIKGCTKLGPKYFGPFMISERIGDMAHKLQLSEGARLLNVFHIRVLKKFHGTPLASLGLLPLIKNGRACVEPEEVSKSRLARGCRQFLVKWKGQDAASSSWVDAEEFLELYPAFELTDEFILQGGRDVMWGKVYARHGKRATKQGAASATAASKEARDATVTKQSHAE
jgi:hypothetical protein